MSITHLIDLETLIPNARFDIRYATTNNFTGKIIYPAARCFLEREAVYALQKVQQKLMQQGLGLKIFDGYRPLSVQRIFWNILPDENYVANPEKGSRHNRGCAIDLTLVNKAGNDLPMGSDFDDFSERAHRNYVNLSAQEQHNRLLLETHMQEEGFIGWPLEWWHFDFYTWHDHPLMDISFEELDKQAAHRSSL